MLPIVPIALGTATLGGLIYALTRKSTPKGSAAIAQLADETTVTMPRGERAFKADVATGIFGALASRHYVWPDPNERRVVALKPSESGEPIPTSISALGWVQTMNRTQSILASVTTASTTAQANMLRAVPPGDEHLYAADGGLYAVLLYQGSLDKKLAPPGSPPTSTTPVGPLPVDPLEVVRDELANSPDLMAKVLTALQEGDDPVALDALGDAADAVGAHGTAALCHQRAKALRGSGPVPPFKPDPVVPPPPPPRPSPVPPPQPSGLPNLPPPAVLAAGQTAIVITQTDPLIIRSAPNLQASQVGSAAKGAALLVTGPISGGYYPVLYGQTRGYAYGGYLRLSQGPVNPQPPGQPPLPAPVPIPMGSAIVITKTDPLSVRSAPSTTASTVGSIPKGATTQITGNVQNGFSPVSYANLHGYAYSGYLQPTGSAGAPLPPPPPSIPVTALPPPNPVNEGAKAIVTTQQDPLSLRNQPSTNGSVVGSLPKGATVIVTGPMQNNFYPVAYGSAHGYASASYLKMVGGAS